MIFVNQMIQIIIYSCLRIYLLGPCVSRTTFSLLCISKSKLIDIDTNAPCQILITRLALSTSNYSPYLDRLL